MLWRKLAMAMGGCWARQSDAGCVEIQKSALERTEFKLKRLRRNQRPDREEIFEVVREVAEAIINNFVSRE